MKEKRMPSADLETIIPILIAQWRRIRKESGPADKLQTREFRTTVELVKALQARSYQDQSLVGQDYFAKSELLTAYILYQWIIHYQEALSLINEIPMTPRRVLDVCSGPAPMAFAALRHGAREVYAVDRNETALQLGAEICGRYGMPLTVRKWNCLREPLPIEGKFDLIILGHALEDLFPEGGEKQQQFIHSLMKRLTPEGYLLIVENSFPDANKRVLQLRDHFVKEGVPVQAPCVWKGECPALKTANSPCYAQREMEKPFLVKEIQRAADINLSSLKMSYVIFRNPEAGWPSLPDKPLYRVVSPPIDSHMGKRFFLCGTDGKKNLGARIDPLPKEARAFEYLRRGELISVENAFENQQSMDIVEGTKVTVEAACGKPLKTEDDEE